MKSRFNYIQLGGEEVLAVGKVVRCYEVVLVRRGKI